MRLCMIDLVILLPLLEVRNYMRALLSSLALVEKSS